MDSNEYKTVTYRIRKQLRFKPLKTPRVDLPGEVWKPLPGFEGLYEVSDLGRVYTIRAHKILDLSPSSNGYYMATLFDKKSQRTRKHVHYLVAITFIGPRPKGQVINHLDGVKTNNAAINLEYVTPSENSIHAHKLGLTKVKRGEQAHNAKLTAFDVRQILHDFFDNELGILSLSKKYNLNFSAVRGIVTGKNWAHIYSEFNSSDYKGIIARSVHRFGLSKYDYDLMLYRRIVLDEARDTLSEEYGVSPRFIQSREKEYENLGSRSSTNKRF